MNVDMEAYFSTFENDKNVGLECEKPVEGLTERARRVAGKLGGSMMTEDLLKGSFTILFNNVSTRDRFIRSLSREGVRVVYAPKR